ncbi:hypothetical protein [Actinomadura parmotrematis]|uniref:Uncharacterized protein n=1 Tax=Actinomadura parmotrematis TaxID=2864039 RepID=A0ABS7FYF0_9ACTN|nr:hypothetical protein [Actinomadura parmotrematis]MBW8485466.1 hypothetical protein [Actinomadura parmotrematis]
MRTDSRTRKDAGIEAGIVTAGWEPEVEVRNGRAEEVDINPVTIRFVGKATVLDDGDGGALRGDVGGAEVGLRICQGAGDTLTTSITLDWGGPRVLAPGETLRLSFPATRYVDYIDDLKPIRAAVAAPAVPAG